MNQTILYIGLYLLVTFANVTFSKVSNYGGWSNSPDNQYHIQSDEGEERYFKYQTKSGQYRKEKRLPDGTVVGTYGWVDPNGYLRLRDYVADNQGYRIVKSKLIYVGKNSYDGESTRQSFHAKYSSPAVTFQPPFGNRPRGFDDYHSRRPTTTYEPSEGDHENSQVPAPLYSSSTPLVHVPHTTSLSGPSASNPLAFAASYGRPSLEYLPSATRHFESVGGPTPAPIARVRASPDEYVAATPPAPVSGKVYYPSSPDHLFADAGNNELSFGKDAAYEGENDHQEYDGVWTVQNGFRYFLPRHYHEETFEDDKGERAGSFGYIDPFGIRRVVYYNASPSKGFLHRKNNRYVGLSARPYDPRPNF